MKVIFILLIIFPYMMPLTERKIKIYDAVYYRCLKDENNPRLEIFIKSEGTGFTEPLEFELKFKDYEYIPTKCVISKDGEEYEDRKLICTMNITIFGVPKMFEAPKEPPKLENVIIEDWDVVTGRIIAGMCTRDYTYFFKPSNDYHLFCNEKEKNLEIKGKIKNYTYINETSKSNLLNVKPYLLIKNKTEEVECSITFDGLKREDEDAKMKCKITSKENEGKFVMTTYYVNNKKYYVGIGDSDNLNFMNCESSSSSFIKILWVSFIVILIL